MSKFVILIAIFYTSLFAKLETFPFLGVNISTQTMDIKSPSNTSSRETGFNLRYGQQTLDWRTTFAVGGNGTFQTFSLEIDKILLDNMFGMPELRPYLGAIVGYINYKDDAVVDGKGLYFGGNFGFIIYVTDNIDMDISYHYNKFQDLGPINTMQGITFGLNFFY